MKTNPIKETKEDSWDGELPRYVGTIIGLVNSSPTPREDIAMVVNTEIAQERQRVAEEIVEMVMSRIDDYEVVLDGGERQETRVMAMIDFPDTLLAQIKQKYIERKDV